MPLIVFEGPEGAGKSTQVLSLVARLTARGDKVRTFREPGGTDLGEQVRQILLDGSEMAPEAEALLFMASRAHLINREINPALAAGVTVILDRFFLSTYAYQIAGRGLSEVDVVAANRLATGGLKPDLNIVLSLPPEVGMQRVGLRGPGDRMERADPAFHQRVSNAFSAFATSDWQSAHPECGRVVTVDASGTSDEVSERVFAAFNSAAVYFDARSLGAKGAGRVR